MLNELGVATVLFDFRGHGKSSGDSVMDFTISGQLIDLETVLSFVQSQGFSLISIAGASFGGGAVALFCKQHSSTFEQVVLVNPVLDYDATFLNPITDWGKKYFSDYLIQCEKKGFVGIGSRQFHVGKKLFDEMNEYSPCKALQNYSAPLFVLHGDQDSYVDYLTTKKCFDLIQSSQKQFETIKGSEHGFHEEPYETQVTKEIVEFLI